MLGHVNEGKDDKGNGKKGKCPPTKGVKRRLVGWAREGCNKTDSCHMLSEGGKSVMLSELRSEDVK